MAFLFPWVYTAVLLACAMVGQSGPEGSRMVTKARRTAQDLWKLGEGDTRRELEKSVRWRPPEEFTGG